MLAGLDNPIWRSEGRYLLPLERQVEAFRRADPPPEHKLAVPVAVPEHLIQVSQAAQHPRNEAVADLVTIGFYFLLHVGEYTHTNEKQRRRTKQFRAKDVTFWDSTGAVIPNTAPLATLAQAAEATLSISNQKNGTRGSLIHHEANHELSCPVAALARRVHHIMARGVADDMLGTYFNPHGYKMHIVAGDINKAIKLAVTSLGLEKKGFPPSAVSSHSLRAGGAKAMHLNGASPLAIRKMGRWSSDTFLMYIHEQIAAFSEGMSTAMSTKIEWRNIAGPTLVGDDDEDQPDTPTFAAF